MRYGHQRRPDHHFQRQELSKPGWRARARGTEGSELHLKPAAGYLQPGALPTSPP